MDSKLIIFSDASKSDTGDKKVKNVRLYLKGIKLITAVHRSKEK